MQDKFRVNRQPFELSDRRRVTFYAAVWDSPAVVFDDGPDGKRIQYREMIPASAFMNALQRSNNIVADIDHDKSKVFAQTGDGSLLIQSDPHGLFCSAWIPDTPLGNQILNDIQNGKLTGCSFHAVYMPNAQKWRMDGDMPECVVEEIVQLVDVCLTNNPAYEETDVMMRTNTRSKGIVEVFRFRKLNMNTKYIKPITPDKYDR